MPLVRRAEQPTDSPAGISGDIIGRPLLSASDSPEAFDLVSRWMSACLTRHRSCRQTLSGSEIDESEPPILPSRILQIGKSGEIVTTKLLVANGARGHYVALSHCWGARTHHPPMTTQSNLDHHLAGIPWTALPRLYQEAITATSRLGFSYLWIDSLCIIQDSHLDWLAESKRMGDVYQHARLTIAASHATDSNQPCFFPREPVPQAVALASPDSTTAYDGVYVTSMPTDYTPISPEFGALAYRAWATQEWLLSRRMLFYTAGHLVWSCKTITQRETGASFHDTARNPRWKNIVEKYSARQLTKPSDRLVALEGVRSELQRKRPDDVYCYGLWKNAMPDQLLWYCVHKGEEGMRDLKLPSWTWASRLAKVRFLDVEGMKNTCKWFRVDEDERRLGIGGVVRKIESVTPLGDGTREASSSVVSNVPWEIVDPALLFGIGDGAGSMIGWCVLDDYEVSKGNVFGLQLMSKTVKTREDGIKLKTYIDNVLLMQRKEALEESFMRIGVGVLTMSTPWLGDIPHQSINIR